MIKKPAANPASKGPGSGRSRTRRATLEESSGETAAAAAAAAPSGWRGRCLAAAASGWLLGLLAGGGRPAPRGAEGGGGERIHAPWAQGGGKGGRGGVGNPFAKSFADARKGAEKEGGGKKQKFGWQAMG